MGSGKWAVESGQWKVGSGQWVVGSMRVLAWPDFEWKTDASFGMVAAVVGRRLIRGRCLPRPEVRWIACVSRCKAAACEAASGRSTEPPARGNYLTQPRFFCAADRTSGEHQAGWAICGEGDRRIRARCRGATRGPISDDAAGTAVANRVVANRVVARRPKRMAVLRSSALVERSHAANHWPGLSSTSMGTPLRFFGVVERFGLGPSARRDHVLASSGIQVLRCGPVYLAVGRIKRL